MRLTQSLLFRLALIYAGLFLTSVSVLIALFYWVSIWRPLEQIKDGIRAEASSFMQRYSDGEAAGLASALQARALLPDPPKRYHALIDPQGETVTSNLPTWPRYRGSRWLEIEADIYRNGDEVDYEALVLDRRLPDGSRLLLGRDIEGLEDVQEALWQAGIWGLPSLALLVVVGGAAMSLTVTRRLDAIDRAARRVMEGSLADRIPMANTGDDLDRLVGTLNEMLARIEKSVTSVRRVSDSVAHELRTPLARLHSTLVEMREPDRPNDKLEDAIAEAERMIQMFDAVLRISRIEGGRHSVEHETVGIGQIVTDVVEFYEPAIEEASVRLKSHVAENVQVVGDRDLIFQALANLLDNAVKFTPQGGAISITARCDDGHVLLAITDTGPGIPSEIRGLVTERFYRGPHSANRQGFGLGLALVEAVANLHRSTLRFVDAQPGLTVLWSFPAPGATAP